MFGKEDIVYTGNFSMEGIDTIWVEENSRDIIFLHGAGEELVVKEYGDSDTELARAEKRGTALCFEGSGKRHVSIEITGPVSVFSSRRMERMIELSIPAGFKGQIYAGSKSGDVFLEGAWELQNLQVRTASGDTNIGNVQAEHILIESKSGDIDVNEAWGDRQLFSVSGDICLAGGRGRLHVKTTSGDMELGGMYGETMLESISGDIEAGFAAVTYPVKITTVSGDTDVKIAADSNVIIEAKAVSGDVSAYLPRAQMGNNSEHHITARMGSGAVENTPVMDISSVSGDICVSS